MMAWCADHDCPTSMCDEYDHSAPPPTRSVGGHQVGGKTEYTWQRVAMAAKQSGMAVLMVTRHGAFQVKYIPDKPQPECGVPKPSQEMVMVLMDYSNLDEPKARIACQAILHWQSLQPECGVPVAPPRPFLIKPAKRQWWRPSTWRSK